MVHKLIAIYLLGYFLIVALSISLTSFIGEVIQMMVSFRPKYFIIIFTLIFNGRLGFSDNTKLHEAEGTLLTTLFKTPLYFSSVVSIPLFLLRFCVFWEIYKSNYFLNLWWWWMFNFDWNWEVGALKEIGKKLGKKDWDFNKDPCSGEGNWVITTYTTKEFESNITCDCSFPPPNSSCHIIRM